MRVTEAVESDEEYFFKSLELFHSAQWLYNGPVTKVLLAGYLDELPKDWSSVLQRLENKEFNDFIATRQIQLNWPKTLKGFVEKCIQADSLPSEKFPSFSADLPKSFFNGLTPKKRHEIVHLAQLIRNKCSPLAIETVVDIGAGLGYVSQLVHHLYGYKVLCLEANLEHANAAKRRQIQHYPGSKDYVKYVHCEVTCDSAERIESALYAEFKERRDFCLVGLHACGDLSVDALKIFSKLKRARLVILVPCCYHKLSIIDNSGRAGNEETFNNFPMSSTLRGVVDVSRYNIGLFLTRPFLRLACQEPAERWHDATEDSHRQHSFCVLARAVLQLYAERNNLILRKRARKGTRKSQCRNFETYLDDSLRRYNFECNSGKGERSLTDDELRNGIAQLWEENSEKLKAVKVYAGLQLLLQSPAESLILSDRLCWLKERGLEAQVVSVASKLLSPRSHAIVSMKK